MGEGGGEKISRAFCPNPNYFPSMILRLHSIWQSGAVMLNLLVQYVVVGPDEKDVNEYLLPKKKNSELKFAPVTLKSIK